MDINSVPLTARHASEILQSAFYSVCANPRFDEVIKDPTEREQAQWDFDDAYEILQTAYGAVTGGAKLRFPDQSEAPTSMPEYGY